MADKHRKQCSKSIVINKMKFITTVRCYTCSYTCIRMATKKKTKNKLIPSVGKHVEKIGTW